MKKVINYYSIFGALIIMLLNVTAFAVSADSGLINKYGTDFVITLAIYNIAIIGNIVLAGIAFHAASLKFIKGRTDVINYDLIIKFGLTLLLIACIGLVFILVTVLPSFIGPILAFAVLIFNAYIMLKECEKLDKVLGFFRSKLFLAIVLPAVAAITALSLLSAYVIIPSVKYNSALSDANSGNKKAAVLKLHNLNGYKDSNNKIKELISQDESLAIYNANIGDTVKFGKYEQDSKEENGKEQIEWKVLDKTGNKLFLISVNCLDCKMYNDEFEGVTWETCTLRKWLNDTFYNTAFNDAEKAMIVNSKISNPTTQYSTRKINGGNATKDNVFLLSLPEAKSYFLTPASALAKSTQYALDNGAYKDGDTGYSWWWLRSPGADTTVACSVNLNDITLTFSKVNGKVDTKNYGVRPCIYVNLEK